MPDNEGLTDEQLKEAYIKLDNLCLLLRAAKVMADFFEEVEEEVIAEDLTIQMELFQDEINEVLTEIHITPINWSLVTGLDLQNFHWTNEEVIE